MIRLRLFAAISVAFIPVLVTGVPASGATAPCDTHQVNGGDEAFLMSLSTPLEFGGTVYNGNVYVSPKGTITFGQGDFTFWDYPATPSISIASWDYHAFPNQFTSGSWNPGWGLNKDLYVRYGSTSTSICVDWKVLPWGQSSGEPVYIRMLAEVNPDNYTWTPTYQVSSNVPNGARYGVRYTQGGPVLPLTIQTITEPPAPNPVIEPTPEPTVEPSPSPSPEEPTPTPTPEVTPSPSPTQTPLPSPTPEETLVPEPMEPEPSPQPTLTPQPTPEPVMPEPQLPAEIVPNPEPVPTSTPEPPVVEALPNTPKPPVVEPELEPTKEEVLEQLMLAAEEDDLQLPEELAAIPLIGDVAGAVLDAFNALGNVGADMTPEVREQSEKVIVASVIVSQIALGATSLSTSLNRKI